LLLREKERLESAREPVDRNILRYLGLEHLWYGLFAEAIPYLDAWREAAGGEWTDERLVATNALATCRRLTGDVESAIALGLEAFEARPDWAETAVTLTQAYRTLGRWEETLAWARRAASLSVPVSEMPVEPLKLTVLPHLRAAEAALMLERPDVARVEFEAATEAEPEAGTLVRRYTDFDRLLAAGDSTGALKCVHAAAGQYDTELTALVRGLQSDAQAGSSSYDKRSTTQAKRPYSSRVSSSKS
jgi:tetratricopeptide (TPR) repeat protein